MTHDVFMTDDNIMILFTFRSWISSNKSYTNLTSTINLTPTILDYLGYLSDSFLNNIQGTSILAGIKNIDLNLSSSCELTRTDARFLGQSSRVCAIRSDTHKLVYEYDFDKYTFYQVFPDSLDVQIFPDLDSQIFLPHKKFLHDTNLFAESIVHAKLSKLAYKIFKRIKSRRLKNASILISVTVHQLTYLHLRRILFNYVQLIVYLLLLFKIFDDYSTLPDLIKARPIKVLLYRDELL